MIERLVIHRFRGIRQGVIEELGKINLLIGPNNSGKSSVLEILYLGGVSGRPGALILGLPVETPAFPATVPLAYDLLGYEPLPRIRLRHGHRAEWRENPVVLTAEGGLEVNFSQLAPRVQMESFRLAAPLEEWGTKSRRFTQQDTRRIASFSIDKQLDGLIPNLLIPPFFVQSGVDPAKTRWHYLWQSDLVYRFDAKDTVDYFAVWAEEGLPPAAQKVLFFDFHATEHHFTEHFFQSAWKSIPRWYEKIAESMGKIFPDLKGAQVEIQDAPDDQKGKSGYLRFPEKEPISVDHFGDGARHAFKVLASLIALTETVDEEHPGLFLWEDPELFMHPASLSRLIGEVIRLIGEKPVQISLSTQSLEVLAWFIHAMEEGHLPSHQVRTFYLSLEAGILRSELFRGKALAHWWTLSGDPRMVREDEMSSPLTWLLSHREEGE